MTFILENLSTIIVGVVVLGIIAFALARTILNFRKGRSPCGCNKCGASGNTCGQGSSRTSR
ncbi:MAG: FeoB-associated Cys-rich membrane protein [Treponema sp.]|jgi:hypothetical protein|nr:FeoB-associated Cys-rich membrane protein [Treponema sp.]